MSWKRTKLGKFLEVRKGKFKPNDSAIANLKRVDKIDFSGQIHLSSKSSNTDMILIKKGDLLISGINVAKGAVTVYEGEEDIVATVHYSSYVYDADRIDITFLKLFLQSPEFFDAIREQIPGGIKTEIKPKHLLPLEVIIPFTLTEQKEVAALYFAFQAKQNLLDSEFNHQLTYLTQLRQALLREAMQGQIISQDPTDEPAALLLKKLHAARSKKSEVSLFTEEAEETEFPFEIPKTWTWCEFGDYVTFERGKFSARPRNDPQYFGGEHLFIQIGSLDARGSTIYTAPQSLNDAGLKVSKKFKKGTIVIAIVGGTIGNLGVLGVDMCFPDSVIGVQPKGGICQEFVLYTLRARQDEIKKFAYQMAGQPNIKIPILSELFIALPPLAEQYRIVAKLEQLMQHCDALEQRIRESRRLAEQLLQTALREALAPPAGTVPTEEAEPELAEADAAPAPARRGRPRQPRFSLDNPPPDLFDF